LSLTRGVRTLSRGHNARVFFMRPGQLAGWQRVGRSSWDALNRVFDPDILRQTHRPGRLDGNHDVVEPAVAAELLVRRPFDLELHLHPDEREPLDPGADDETVAEPERTFEVH